MPAFIYAVKDDIAVSVCARLKKENPGYSGVAQAEILPRLHVTEA
jgi:hypothetical protein